MIAAAGPQPDVHLARLGRHARAARRLAGLTQEELAARVGLSRASISNIEAGRQDTSVTMLLALAEGLGISVGALFDAEPPGTAQAVERFALELISDLPDVEGSELDLGGKTWLVTTEADIAEWLAWHVHSEDPDAPSEDAAGNPQEVCLCGEVFVGGDWTEVTDAVGRHKEQKRTEYRQAAEQGRSGS